MTSLAFPLVCPGCIETPRERLGCARRMAFGLLFALALGVCAAAAPTAPVAPANAGTAPGSIADLTLEQLMDVTVDRVYGASRHMQKVTQAPSAVSIVSGDEVTRYGWRTLGDLLRSVRGLYVANDFNYSYVGVRGFLRPGDYDTRLLVLVDGHRMNDNIYDAAYVGPEAAFDPATVDRVEVIRGPSSSIYGSSAFFGVINVVTKRGAQLEGGRVAADVGSFGTREGSLAYGKKFGAVDWVASASYLDRRGRGAIYFPEFDPRRSALPEAANDGIAQNADGERVQRIATSLAWRDVTLSAFASRR